VLGGADLVYHGAGWLEGGLTASFEKLVLDVELLQTMARTVAPVDVSAGELEDGLAALAEVPAGGHFFGAAHTLARYETAFYEPLLSDWTSFEAWEGAGARTATERATEIWQRTLAAYEPPALDPAVREALEAFVARRRREIERAGSP
jgi:trimethylamine--corrinoid protein Co-methyltransferase